MCLSKTAFTTGGTPLSVYSLGVAGLHICCSCDGLMQLLYGMITQHDPYDMMGPMHPVVSMSLGINLRSIVLAAQALSLECADSETAQ
jgi:hypothetical protein